jgi:hypothetical protein
LHIEPAGGQFPQYRFRRAPKAIHVLGFLPITLAHTRYVVRICIQLCHQLGSAFRGILGAITFQGRNLNTTSPLETACRNGPDNCVVGLTHNSNLYPLLDA